MPRDKDKQREWFLANKEKLKEQKKKFERKPERIAYNKRKCYFRDYVCATEEDYTHYLSVTHCECCGALLTGGWKEKNSKCQDHDHVTGELRGVICKACNTIEGWTRDIDHLESIVAYLKSQRLK